MVWRLSGSWGNKVCEYSYLFWNGLLGLVFNRLSSSWGRICLG